jgi:integrase/recombinase XerD
MASVKIVLRSKKNKDGTYPLAIRITKDRKSSFVHVGQNLKITEWNKKTHLVKSSHPNSARLNNFLLKKLSQANDKLLELETNRNDASPQAVRYSMKPLTHGTTFFSVAKSFLDNFKKAGKYNRYYPEQSRIEQFRKFLDGADITFQDISVGLLNRFSAYLKGENLSERTVMNHLLVIRTIFNVAIKGNIVDQKYYPFGKGKIKIRFPESLKIGLTPEEVKKVENLSLKPGSYLNHAKNLWLFSFYFAGMRVSDVLRLRWTDFQNDRLYYAMGKNTKPGSLKVPEKALLILSQYKVEKRNENDLIFPELKVLPNLDNLFEVQRKISYADQRIDNALRKVSEKLKLNKKLTMHIARHTFGNISGERISIQMLQKLYRHSSITTTIGYQANFIHKDADDALDAVVGF